MVLTGVNPHQPPAPVKSFNMSQPTPSTSALSSSSNARKQAHQKAHQKARARRRAPRAAAAGANALKYALHFPMDGDRKPRWVAFRNSNELRNRLCAYHHNPTHSKSYTRPDGQIHTLNFATDTLLFRDGSRSLALLVMHDDDFCTLCPESPDYDLRFVNGRQSKDLPPNHTFSGVSPALGQFIRNKLGLPFFAGELYLFAEAISATAATAAECAASFPYGTDQAQIEDGAEADLAPFAAACERLLGGSVPASASGTSLVYRYHALSCPRFGTVTVLDRCDTCPPLPISSLRFVRSITPPDSPAGAELCSSSS